MKFVIKKGGDDKDFVFNEERLPILIHGEEGSGASFFSVCVAAQYYLNGSKLIFFSLKEAAKEEFKKIIANREGDVIFCPSGNSDKALEIISSADSGYLIFIKNIEETLTRELLSLIMSRKFILSGDLDKSILKDQIMNLDFETKIAFSRSALFPPFNVNKHEGVFNTVNSIIKVIK